MDFNNNQEIRINDFPPTKIYVLLNKAMRKKLIECSKVSLRIRKNNELAIWLNKKSLKYGLNTKFNGGDVNNWILGRKLDTRTNMNHPKYMPLWILLELFNTSGMSLDKINNNILSYRSGGRGKTISNPRIPIKITPEFESIIFHLFGDGHAGNFTPSYYQKNILSNRQFVLKLKNCFGQFEERINRDKFQVRFPKAITDILSYYYEIKSYHSGNIRIPNKVYKTSRLNKLACIISFILDEGNIRDVINISSKNKEFLLDLKRLIEDCGYKYQQVKPHKGSDTFYLNLSNKSIDAFYHDYIILTKRFSTCGLANKHKQLIT